MSSSVPSSARMYDYYLGGKDNGAADRQAAEQVLRLLPEARLAARANRGFLVRAVRHLAESGIDQYIDLGTGIPTSPNVHEVARETIAHSRVVYVDNDPVVTAHNKAFRSTRDGVLSVDMDIRNGGSLRDHPEVRELIDFRRPIGVLMIAVMHLLSTDEAAAALDGVRSWIPDDSFLVLSAATTEGMTAEQIDELAAVYQNTGSHPTGLTRDAFTGMFDGFEVLAPGITSLGKWRTDEPDPQHLACLCGVGRLTR